MYVHTHTLTHTRMYVCVYVHIRIDVHIYVHTYVCMYVCIYICIECADFTSLTPEASAYFQHICEAPWVQEWLRAAEQEKGNAELKIARYDTVKAV